MVSRRSRDKQTLGTRIISLESETAKNKRDSSGEFIEEDDSARQTVFTEDLGNIERIFATNNLAISAPGGVQINGHQIDPAGNVVMTARTTAPDGWLLCEGQAVSRTVFAVLFSAIGVQYGGGDGSTTFNIPDMRGRVPVGRDAGQSEFNSEGEAGGAKTHDHTGPSHSHTGPSHQHNGPSHTHRHWSPVGMNSGIPRAINPTAIGGVSSTVFNSIQPNIAQGNHNVITGGVEVFLVTSEAGGSGLTSAGGSGATGAGGTGATSSSSTLQPYRVLNFIIKT